MPTSSSKHSSSRSKRSRAEARGAGDMRAARDTTNRHVPPAASLAGYALAIFLSSSLLFLIEPIAGKRVLPLLGGSAAVWTACLVFFQAALLLGYFTAHWLATRLSARAQVAVYLALLALSLGQLLVAPELRASA